MNCIRFYLSSKSNFSSSSTQRPSGERRAVWGRPIPALIATGSLQLGMNITALTRKHEGHHSSFFGRTGYGWQRHLSLYWLPHTSPGSARWYGVGGNSANCEYLDLFSVGDPCSTSKLMLLFFFNGPPSCCLRLSLGVVAASGSLPFASGIGLGLRLSSLFPGFCPLGSGNVSFFLYFEDSSNSF